jgi:hypothetical protein
MMSSLALTREQQTVRMVMALQLQAVQEVVQQGKHQQLELRLNNHLKRAMVII